MLSKAEFEVYKFSKEQSLFEEGNKVLLAISGGMDSMVLLHIMHKLKEKLNIKIAVAHYNHGIRDESDQEEIFVKTKSQELGIDFFSEKGNLKNLKEGNLEDIARRKRYEFFFRVMKNERFDKLVTAHHMLDLLETIIYRLTRGSGILGIVGLLPKQGKIARPLLCLTHGEIKEYAENNKIEYKIDKSNFDLNFSRNKIRHKVIPVLEEINPQVERNAFKFAKVVWKYREEVERKYKDRVLKENDMEILNLNGDIFDAEILRFIFIRSGLYPPNFEETEKILRMKTKGIRDFGRIKIKKEKNKLILSFVERRNQV